MNINNMNINTHFSPVNKQPARRFFPKSPIMPQHLICFSSPRSISPRSPKPFTVHKAVQFSKWSRISAFFAKHADSSCPLPTLVINVNVGSTPIPISPSSGNRFLASSFEIEEDFSRLHASHVVDVSVKFPSTGESFCGFWLPEFQDHLNQPSREIFASQHIPAAISNKLAGDNKIVFSLNEKVDVPRGYDDHVQGCSASLETKKQPDFEDVALIEFECWRLSNSDPSAVPDQAGVGLFSSFVPFCSVVTKI